MKISDAAAASGCHHETIRYYERIGLLPKLQRTACGYRRFGPENVERLRFISRGRELGFSLDEICSLLRLASDPDLSCAAVDRLARQHLLEIERKTNELKRMATELKQTITGCAGGKRAACTILQTLQS